MVRGCIDIQEHQLVSAKRVIDSRFANGVARIPKVLKTSSLHGAAIAYEQLWNDAPSKHLFYFDGPKARLLPTRVANPKNT